MMEVSMFGFVRMTISFAKSKDPPFLKIFIGKDCIFLRAARTASMRLMSTFVAKFFFICSSELCVGTGRSSSIREGCVCVKEMAESLLAGESMKVLSRSKLRLTLKERSPSVLLSLRREFLRMREAELSGEAVLGW